MLQTLSDKSYDGYIDWCTSPATIKAVGEKLNLPPRNVRLFLAAYAFRYWPDEVISQRNGLDNEQITSAISLTEKGEVAWSDASQLPAFKAQLATYVTAFHSWLQLDKLRVAHPFIVKYRQLRMLRERVEREGRYYTRELKQLVDMSYLLLIGQINQLGGEAALAQIDTLSVESDPAYETEFIALSQEAFWAGFRERLPDYEPIIPLFVDFVHRHMALIPYQQQRLERLTEVIDVEFIRQKLEHTTVTVSELLGYLNFIIEQAVEVGAEADEQKTRDRLTALLDTTLAPVDLIQGFFRELFAYYDQLLLVVQQLRAS